MKAAWLAPVVVDDSYVVRVALGPAEEDSPLVVDSDAVEAAPLPPERLEPVARRRAKIVDGTSRIEHVELA